MAAPTCYLCGCSDSLQISSKLRDGLESRFPQRPYRCQNCQLVFLFPLFSPEEEKWFYAHEYRKIYHGGEYNLAKFHQARLPDTLSRLTRLQDSGLLKGKVLDIGSSTGSFLEAIRPKVEAVKGVEPDERQRNHAREGLALDVVADIADLEKGERFDLITLFHVLEHIRDPAEFLAALSQHLAPDGTLVIEVPNVEDALIACYHIDEFETYYWHPAHSYYFSAATLEKVAARAGLTAKVSGIQRYKISNHLSWLRDRRPGGKTVEVTFLTAKTEQAYAEDLCRSLKSDTLWMTAKRD